MRVLVDTCIWSLALRRKNNQTNHQQAIVEKLRHLIDEQQVVMLGVIRQEILSGIQHQEQFERIRNKLRPFPDYPITTTDFETAAEFFNRCRTKGIQGSDTDFLICAVANAYDFRIMTFDKDFEYFSKHIDLKVDLFESS
ncbi:MAG: hypothetical protein RL236_447 [Pseudomonadota bacterium]|jgi:predicted nucleic acid-binding protein